jgi:hypothetical protein
MCNIFKMNASRRDKNSGTTNMFYFHTCVVGNMHLILTTTVLIHDQLVQVSYDVICCIVAHILGWIKVVGGGYVTLAVFFGSV